MISPIVLILQVFLGASTAQAAIPAPLRAIEKKYQTEGQFEADLEQTTENASFKTVKKGKGRIWVKRPGQVRWETYSPDPSTLVTDGKTYWYYTPPFDANEAGQLIEKPASKVKSELATVLLAGEFSRSKNLRISGVGHNQFKVIPKKGSAGSVQQAILEIDPTSSTIRRIEILHTDGNRAEITLKDMRFGAQADIHGETFRFRAPPRTERMSD